MKNTTKTKKRSWILRFLDKIEVAGNKLPTPLTSSTVPLPELYISPAALHPRAEPIPETMTTALPDKRIW